MSTQNICDYIELKAQVTVSVEKINMTQDRLYNSLNFFVSEQKLEIFLNDNFWLDGGKFRQFIHLRRRLQAQETTNSASDNLLTI